MSATTARAPGSSTRTDGGLRLKHDHRTRTAATTPARCTARHRHGRHGVATGVPVDQYSIDMFAKAGNTASATNTWAMEVEPGVLRLRVGASGRAPVPVEFDLPNRSPRRRLHGAPSNPGEPTDHEEGAARRLLHVQQPPTPQASSGTLTLNHAAYSAGRNSNVSRVATSNPPMIATAIGPKNALRDSGSSPGSRPARSARSAGTPHRRLDDRLPRLAALAAVLFDLVNQDHRVAHDHARQRDCAEHRHEPERHPEHQQNSVTPISPTARSAAP